MCCGTSCVLWRRQKILDGAVVCITLRAFPIFFVSVPLFRSLTPMHVPGPPSPRAPEAVEERTPARSVHRGASV